MDRMEIDTGKSASPTSSRASPAAASKNPKPPTKKRVAFAIPSEPQVSNSQNHRPTPPPPPRWASPPPPAAPPSNSPPPPPPANPITSTPPPSVNLLPAIFLPFHGVPTPASSSPPTRHQTLVQTIDNLALQTAATKRFQIFLTLQERDRILAAEHAAHAARLAREDAMGVYTHPVADEEMDTILARLGAPTEQGRRGREYEHVSAKWVVDPVEADAWRRPGGEAFSHGTAEKLLELTVRAAAGMRRYEAQGEEVVGRKKRALESEMRRMGELEGMTRGGDGAKRFL